MDENIVSFASHRRNVDSFKGGFFYIMRILIVEDEIALADALAQIFYKNKYLADTAYDGESGLDNALTDIYDVIILDIMLPKMNGLDVLKNLRMNKISTPVLLLTAKDEVSDKVKGLDMGADDYLTKPFATEELLARVRSMYRRKEKIIVENALSHNDVSLNLSTYELECNGMSVKLGLKEYSIMEFFLKNHGMVISKENLIEKIWGYESDAEYNNVEVYISFLRKKLAHIKSSVSIKTVRGVGYRLE
jgi:DNA-binding response OmpR family regulator